MSLVNIVTFVIHVERNTPCGDSLRILVAAINVVAGFVQEQSRPENRGPLRPLTADILVITLAVDLEAVAHARSALGPVECRLIRVVARKINLQSNGHLVAARR